MEAGVWVASPRTSGVCGGKTKGTSESVVANRKQSGERREEGGSGVSEVI